jgi:two-component system, chemotaxis family, response regulator Rcp1
MDILLVEDNLGDIRLVREALEGTVVSASLHVAYDGEEAMTVLRRGLTQTNTSLPDLILLDLNLPKMDGREILTKIKYDKNFRMIPTIILTSSDAETDIRYCYEHYANCYFRKPTQWDAFGKLVKYVNELWLGLAILPEMKG